MNIADVLKVIGNVPMREFPWGQPVLDTINAYVDAEDQLSLNDTGLAVAGAINKLPEKIRSHLLDRPVNKVTFTPVPIPVLTPPPLPTPAPPEPTPPEKVEEFPVGYIRSYRPIITAIMAFLLMAVAAAIAIDESVRVSHAHAIAEHRMTEKLYHLGMDILKILSDDKDSAETAQKPPQASPVVTPQPAPEVTPVLAPQGATVPSSSSTQ